MMKVVKGALMDRRRTSTSRTRLWCKFCSWSCPQAWSGRGTRPFGHAAMLAHIREEHAEQYKALRRQLDGESGVFGGDHGQ